MSRRLIALVTIVLATALSGSAVALAHGGGKDGHRDGAGKRHHVVRAGGGWLWGSSLGGVADRLGVTKDALRDAVKAVAADQRAARQADPSAPKPDLAAKKAAWIDGVAAKLGKTPDEVAAAVRAELDERLTTAVSKGRLTEQGKTLALGCFDAPASCDFKALRAEIRGGDRRHGKRHYGPCRKGDRGADTSSRPGGRETSAPLV